MNRVDFMNQLESLLQNIAPTEREEAIQYYNDYFDDAGKENEQEVIEALGNPARVAENIKRDLLGSGLGDNAGRKVKASDRVMVEYGKSAQEDCKTSGQNTGDTSAEYEQGSRNAEGYGNTSGQTWNPFEDQGTGGPGAADSGGTSSWDYGKSGDFHYEDEKPAEKERMPAWAVAMLVTVLIFASPLWMGAVGLLLGLIAGWFGLIFASGITAVCLLLVLLVLVVVGVMCMFADPWVGIALIGGGLICGCVGILFLMLTVAMAGIITPAVFRGITFIFRGFRKKQARA